MKIESNIISFTKTYLSEYIITMQNLGGLFCPLCLDYFCKPVATICGHSFCELCLEQYYLHFDSCPICDIPTRKQKPSKQTSLANFIESFIRKQHPQYEVRYQQRIKQLQQYKKERAFPMINMITGQKVDIRDHSYRWREGRIIRIISRVGEFHKYIKVEYLDCEEKIEEELKVVSDRLAMHGFYTGRKDIPKFVESRSQK